LLADTYLKNDVLSIQESIVNHAEYTLARSRYNFDDMEAYLATAHSLRDRLIEVWNDTQAYFKDVNTKRVYYLSMEFLMGRSLTNALYNLNVQGPYKEAITELGYDIETLVAQVRCSRSAFHVVPCQLLHACFRLFSSSCGIHTGVTLVNL
jgi:glycogen phosphorylase